MGLEWQPEQLWEPAGQSELHEERPQFRSNLEAERSEDSKFRGIRVENRLTRQIWFFENVKSLYFLSCVEGQFAIAGRQWVQGVYDIYNKTADDLDVITSGCTSHLPAGGRIVLKAHSHV